MRQEKKYYEQKLRDYVLARYGTIDIFKGNVYLYAFREWIMIHESPFENEVMFEDIYTTLMDEFQTKLNITDLSLFRYGG